MNRIITNREKQHALNAYMTLEASFIIPFVFICFILIILYTFYLYNHMVVYQSCYLSALRGSQLKNALLRHCRHDRQSHYVIMITTL